MQGFALDRERSVFLVQRTSISMFAPCPVCAAALIAGSGLSALTWLVQTEFTAQMVTLPCLIEDGMVFVFFKLACCSYLLTMWNLRRWEQRSKRMNVYYQVLATFLECLKVCYALYKPWVPSSLFLFCFFSFVLCLSVPWHWLAPQLITEFNKIVKTRN